MVSFVAFVAMPLSFVFLSFNSFYKSKPNTLPLNTLKSLNKHFLFLCFSCVSWQCFYLLFFYLYNSFNKSKPKTLPLNTLRSLSKPFLLFVSFVCLAVNHCSLLFTDYRLLVTRYQSLITICPTTPHNTQLV